MKNLAFFICLTLFMMSACSGPQKPKPFLKEKKMVDFLVEMHLTEGSLQHLQGQSYSFDDMHRYTNAFYDQLFEKYGLTQQTFEANLQYYVHHSRSLERIYAKVDARLKALDSVSRAEQERKAAELEVAR